jgi:hypothetical protein
VCLADSSQLDDLTNVVSKGLASALVLHPVACGLALISFVVTLFALLRRWRHFRTYGTERDGRSRFTSIINFAIILPAALLTTAIFIVDVVLVAAARKKIRDALNGNRSVNLTWDSAVSPNPLAAFIIQNISGLTTPAPQRIILFSLRLFLYPVIPLGLVDTRGGPRPLVRLLRYHLPMWEPTPIPVRVKFRFFTGGPLRSLCLLPSFALP